MIPQFIELHAKPNTKDWKRTRNILGKFDGLKNRPIDQIKRQDVSKVLDRIVANGIPTHANRALSAIKTLMNWCAMRGDIETSPVALLRPPAREDALALMRASFIGWHVRKFTGIKTSLHSPCHCRMRRIE